MSCGFAPLSLKWFASECRCTGPIELPLGDAREAVLDQALAVLERGEEIQHDVAEEQQVDDLCSLQRAFNIQRAACDTSCDMRHMSITHPTHRLTCPHAAHAVALCRTRHTPGATCRRNIVPV